MSECRIEDYALIGDCETAALVGRDGCIDWLCWPRFDSGACFAALLGTAEHGSWRLFSLDEDARSSRRYRPDTLILETRIETPNGVATVVDFMPPRGVASDLVRIVTGVSGQVRMRTEMRLRFDYGRTTPWVSRLPDGTLRAIAGPDMVVMRAQVDHHGEDMSTVAEFTVGAGESVGFVLTYSPSHLSVPEAVAPQAALNDTETFWTEWSGRYRPDTLNGTIAFPPDWHEATKRSLITLKALTYAPTGGVVAAATTSLPEWIGGSRNWDYRYCWLRDSSLTLFALMNGGYFDEAKSWRDWLVRAMAGSPDQLQIMYGLAGERRLDEWEATWLPGFAGSTPVRIGNAAHGQRQLDVYGEVMSALYQARIGGLPEDDQAWSVQRAMLEQLEAIWDEPDEGIWEVRGPPRHFTFSKAMAWLAFDRCIKSAEEFGLDHAPLDKWRTTRDEIHAQICTQGFDHERMTFTQTYGAPALDASLLLLAVIGFLPVTDERITGTIAAVERDLLVDGFVRRYHTSEVTDGLPVGEGAFLACSFWLVNAYTMTGRLDDAKALFERLLSIRNDVGLLAEEYAAREKRQLGNFPQAFSHVSLVNAAHRLGEALARGEAAA